MVVLKVQSEFGHAPPPQTPYSVVSNIPGWKLLKAFVGGDMSPMARVVHIYPRFGPTHFVAQLGQEVSKKLGIEGKGAMLYLNPDMWPYTTRHITNEHRGEHILKADDIELRCVDVGSHRLYAVFFAPQHMKGVMESWGNPGVGLSIRGAETLLKAGADDIREVPFTSIDEPPAPTWTPESEAHQGIKERLSNLMHRAAIDPAKVTCTPKDIYLYPTGMAAIYHLSNTLLKHRPGTIVIFGVPFHNTYHHTLEECPHGWKHVGAVDDKATDEFESWLEAETKANRPVSYVYTEIPGNPALDTPDLVRLKKLAEKYGFVLVVDDTVSSVASVDVMAVSDIVLTSLTKTFNGQANAMGGSIVLNPQSSHYASLSKLYADTHHNELFAAEAEVLLANSIDLLQRTQVHNRNARAIAEYLHGTIDDPASPVTKVRYPSVLPSKALYDRFLRRSTPELPEPGYGCLLTVEFEDDATTEAFYDRLGEGFYPSPHLGGHVSLVLAYNVMAFGRKEVESNYMSGIGVKQEAIRISFGLEEVEDLIDTVKDALDAAKEAKKKAAA